MGDKYGGASGSMDLSNNMGDRYKRSRSTVYLTFPRIKEKKIPIHDLLEVEKIKLANMPEREKHEIDLYNKGVRERNKKAK
jgi:hypothetical protein